MCCILYSAVYAVYGTRTNTQYHSPQYPPQYSQYLPQHPPQYSPHYWYSSPWQSWQYPPQLQFAPLHVQPTARAAADATRAQARRADLERELRGLESAQALEPTPARATLIASLRYDMAQL